MSKRITTTLLATAAAAALLAVGAGAAAASPAASAKPATGVIPIVMKDPGCHWFLVKGKDLAKLSVSGKTTFRNLDEAALIVKGAGLNQRVAVGKTFAIAKPGAYRITMVGQKSDDNHLLLVVK